MEALDDYCQYLVWKFYFSQECIPGIQRKDCSNCVRRIKVTYSLCYPCLLQAHGFSELYSMLYYSHLKVNTAQQ